jgi:hypothetical protein
VRVDAQGVLERQVRAHRLSLGVTAGPFAHGPAVERVRPGARPGERHRAAGVSDGIGSANGFETNGWPKK